jgi:hypothetical protein
MMHSGTTKDEASSDLAAVYIEAYGDPTTAAAVGTTER